MLITWKNGKTTETLYYSCFLTVLLLILRLSGISISGLWIMAPFWIPIVILLICMVLVKFGVINGNITWRK